MTSVAAIFGFCQLLVVGLLVLLITGPLAVILAASVIGIAVLPCFLGDAEKTRANRIGDFYTVGGVAPRAEAIASSTCSAPASRSRSRISRRATPSTGSSATPGAACASPTTSTTPACASYDQYRSFEERGEARAP